MPQIGLFTKGVAWVFLLVVAQNLMMRFGRLYVWLADIYGFDVFEALARQYTFNLTRILVPIL